MDNEEVTIIDESNNTVAPTNNAEEVKDNSIAAYRQTGAALVEKKFNSGDINANEAGKDLAHLMATADSLVENSENKQFLDKFKDKKKEELLASADASLANEESKKISAKQKKAEAFYISYRPILEFDLDHLLVKTPGRKKYKKVLNKDTGKYEKVEIPEDEMEKDIKEKPKHTYEERSYGIPLMVLMLIVLTIPFFICTIVLSIFNMINYVFVAMSRFSKPALIICGTITGIVILGLVIYVALLCIEGAFNITIFRR